MALEPQTSRIERRKQEFRDKITQAALRLFEQQGVAETSVASIIKEADIAHKTFFNHFPSKDHLLQHIVNTYSAHAYGVFREAFKRYTDPAKRVDYCFGSIARTLDSLNPHYKALLNYYLISGAGDLRTVQRGEFIAVVKQIMSDARAQGRLRKGFSVDTLTEMAAGLCVATLLNWSVEDDYPLVPKMKSTVKFINASVFVS